MTYTGITPGRLVLAAATLLSGAATAWLVAGSPSEVLPPVQLVMSVLVPFFGVLLVRDVGPPLVVRLLVALGLAAGFAVAGVLLTTVFAGPPPAGLILASVLVQLIAQLTGTACGLLIRRPGLAMAATIAVPMGVTILLLLLDPGGGLVRWLTPAGNAQSLLGGAPTAGLLVVPLLWCVVPNVVGARHQVASTRA